MRQIKQLFPLLLLILVLCGTLILSLPGAPLYGILMDPEDGVVDPDSPGDNTQPPENNGSNSGNGNETGNGNNNGSENTGESQPPNGNENQGGNDVGGGTQDPGENTNPGDSGNTQNPGDNENQGGNAGGNVTPEPPSYQYSCDILEYLNAITTTYASKSDILLVNKTHPLSADYVPAAFDFLGSQEAVPGKIIWLDATAAQALRALLLCMRADGITDTYVTSGYRSYQEQAQLHEAYIQRERNTISPEAYAYFGYDYIREYYTSQGKDKLSREDAEAVVLSYSAKPGQSEHQSGLCVDFITMSMSGLTNEQFEATAAFRWLQENACQFGFILRYPEDKTDITGYSYESWHYRFVGREAAIEITRRGITLEEYLAGK